MRYMPADEFDNQYAKLTGMRWLRLTTSVGKPSSRM